MTFGSGARVSLIVAADEGDVIGRDGALPWHLPEDLRRFKQLTMGHAVIAGRITHESIEQRLGQPLPGRTTIVVSRHRHEPDTELVRYRHDLPAALAAAREIEGERGEVFVIGGAQIYAGTVGLADRVYLTRVRGRHAGDRMLPPGFLDGFRLVEREFGGACTFETYERAQMSFYYLDNARHEHQRERMRALEAAGICLFCPESLAGDASVVHRTAHWAVRVNDFPYRGARQHFLLVPYEHVEELTQLTAAAQHDFWAALSWVVRRHRLDHYGLAVRNGPPELSAGTIRHLHVHVIQGDVDDPAHQPIQFRLSSPNQR